MELCCGAAVELCCTARLPLTSTNTTSINLSAQFVSQDRATWGAVPGKPQVSNDRQTILGHTEVALTRVEYSKHLVWVGGARLRWSAPTDIRRAERNWARCGSRLFHRGSLRRSLSLRSFSLFKFSFLLFRLSLPDSGSLSRWWCLGQGVLTLVRARSFGPRLVCADSFSRRHPQCGVFAV